MFEAWCLIHPPTHPIYKITKLKKRLYPMGFQIFVFLEKVKVWLLFISPSALEVSFPEWPQDGCQ